MRGSSSPRLLLQEFMRSRHGIVTARDASALGIGRGTMQSLVEARFLEQVGRGIYRSGAWPEMERQLVIGLCGSHPGLAVSHTSAGREWGYRGMADRRLHLLCPHGCSPDIRDAIVHRCRRIDPVDLVEFGDG